MKVPSKSNDNVKIRHFLHYPITGFCEQNRLALAAHPNPLVPFERGIIKERVNAGLKAARARGVRLGRPSTLQKRAAEVLKLKKAGIGLREISRKLSMPASSVHSIVHGNA